ncbi:murein biosynthesis integral membrane protein MurJ [Streptomyces triticiradicis]|uniref:Murein biosynthesis protein MurJ n=1 Tax=Streptomyces triticiradicis TaxID=2651189 RepID=A0A7J5DC75_9ACTN|nr:lipid II flippase MurJ [Streptomyces triticiradicis]KAB1986225.1 murein biosynthesis protein MurJ [Streptomyces triticiradicis]
MSTDTGAGAGTGSGARAGTAPRTEPGPGASGTGAGTGTGTGSGATEESGAGPALPLPSARAARSSAARSPGPRKGADQPEAASNRFLAKAALVTVALSIAGALLGLGRDQALAHLFGAGSDTDAFLIAWTVPEFAATLLIEDGLAFVLIPAFSVAVTRRARGAAGDPVRALVAATLPRLTLAFAAVGALLIAGAPYLVEALAPGLPDPRLAVDCTRLTATCAFSFGLAGYCSAALRAHRRFVAPAAIYMAYNAGIITVMFVLGARWGVRSAALGVAVGGALMVVAQAPSLWRQLRRGEASAGAPADEPARPMDLTLVGTVLLFALCRQSQVLVERFLASSLPAGAISHLNYAQKVAQMPMVLSLMLCTVTFPVVAQAIAEGDTERARDRVERDLTLVACTVLLGTAVVVACAPQIVQLLFQRGAFTAQDTAATAAVMRVYALGLLGHTLVGALVRSYFSSARPTWYPLFAMTAGIVATCSAGALAVGPWGVRGIALANAAGITLTAVLLLHGTGPRSVPIRTRKVVAEIGKTLRAALTAAATGGLCASGVDSPLLGLAVGGTVVTVVFALLAWAFRVEEFTSALRSVTRRVPYARFR